MRLNSFFSSVGISRANSRDSDGVVAVCLATGCIFVLHKIQFHESSLLLDEKIDEIDSLLEMGNVSCL